MQLACLLAGTGRLGEVLLDVLFVGIVGQGDAEVHYFTVDEMGGRSPCPSRCREHRLMCPSLPISLRPRIPERSRRIPFI
jgi:hypothetical protein